MIKPSRPFPTAMTIRAGLPLFTIPILLAALPAAAQDVGSYQLPPASSPTPTAQGPVIPEAPPPRVAPTAEPAPSPSPTITLPPEPAPSVSASAAPRPAPRPSASASANAPVAAESPVTPAPDDGPPIDEPVAPPQIVPTLPDVTREEGTAWWPWVAGALALLGIGGLALFLRRREQVIAEPVFSPPALPVPAPPPSPAPDRPILALGLEAVRMSASLVNATLAYRLTLTAGSDLEQINVRADMTAAHASRPAEEQLGADDAPVLHSIAAMAAGETVVLTGELRLPLSAITPIRHGSAALFVPLVRIAVDGPPHGPGRIRRAFVVGLDENANTLRLQPFRLDHGPRVYAQVGQRELTVPQFA